MKVNLKYKISSLSSLVYIAYVHCHTNVNTHYKYFMQEEQVTLNRSMEQLMDKWARWINGEVEKTERYHNWCRFYEHTHYSINVNP